MTEAFVDPALELIYLQAGCSAQRERMHERTCEALRRVSFSRLVTELQDRRLLPLFGTRLLQAAPDLCPPAFSQKVEAARTLARVRGLAMYAETRHTSRLLEANGIRALPLKGVVLAEDAHGDLGLRGTTDVDLLVPRDRLNDAAALLQAHGYGAPADRLDRQGLPELHLALHHPRRPTVELHWRVHWSEEEFSARMLERAATGDDGLLRADAATACAALLLFYARDGFHGVRLAADLAAWWDRRARDLAPGFMIPWLARYPSLAPSWTAAAEVLEDLTATPSRGWLGQSRSAGGAAIGRRLADWAQAGDRDQMAANISLVSGLLGARGSLPQFARRELVPEGGPPAHTLKMLGRYGAALWRVRRARLWAAPPPRRPARVELMGMPLDVLTESDAIAHVIGSLEGGLGGTAITANLDHLRQYVRRTELRPLFAAAELVLADGMPLVWASRLAGTPLPARVAGSELIWSLTAQAHASGRSIFLLGGAPGVCERAADIMRANYPGLRILGINSPPPGFESDPSAVEEIVEELREAQPDIVYVALGFPKQEQLIATIRAELPRSWFMGVGISCSFLSGDVPRAPNWMQRIGLEWLHRLAMEPQRLGRRYLVEGLPFAARLAAHGIVARAAGGLPILPAPQPGNFNGVRVIFTHGTLERRRAADVATLTEERRG